eukprot:TRINITY_DN1360_c0_g1_i13.p1 TRINITY_DN1360_c0_g1~~TRINITY_DN1360_c0_g1_i13.p1  ORF type:complete len:333 (+),score=63.22 TRINITY_DN1360_c0_g1_i13:31-1029(+)
MGTMKCVRGLFPCCFSSKKREDQRTGQNQSVTNPRPREMSQPQVVFLTRDALSGQDLQKSPERKLRSASKYTADDVEVYNSASPTRSHDNSTSTKEILTKSLPTVTIVLFASDFSTVFVAFLVFSDANEEILESECCNNYLCHYCFDDYNSQLAKNPKQEVACSFCGTRDPLYIDVAPNEKIKIYTDSLLQGEQMRSRRTLFGRDLASMNSPSLKAKTQKYIVRDGNLAPDDDGREKLYASDNGIFIKKANQMNLLPDFALSQSKEVAESRKNDDDEDDLNARDIDEEFQPVDEGGEQKSNAANHPNFIDQNRSSTYRVNNLPQPGARPSSR